jgi:hypothetical protein
MLVAEDPRKTTVDDVQEERDLKDDERAPSSVSQPRVSSITDY